MKNNVYVVDSNVLINLNRGDKKIAILLQGKTLLFSVITEIELLSFPKISQVEIARVKSMLEECILIGLTQDVKEQAIIIRKLTKMKLPDAVVAATARAMKVPLLTADVGFKRAEKLIDVVLI